MDKKQAIIAAAALAGTTVIGVQTAQLISRFNLTLVGALALSMVGLLSLTETSRKFKLL